MNWRKFQFECVLIILIVAALLIPAALRAQDSLHINIYGPGQTGLNLYMAPLKLLTGSNKQQPLALQELQQKLEHNFGYLPFFRMLPGEDILGGREVKGLKAGELDFNRFKMSQVDLLLTQGWRPGSDKLGKVELRVFDVYSGQLILGRGYVLPDASQIPEAANRFCADLMEKITGKSGFFRSKLAFVRKKGSQSKQIYQSTAQGYSLEQLTDLNGVCLSPAWSWDGKWLAFTFVNQDRHELVIRNADSGEFRHILLPGNTIISPAFKPDGQIVISADPRGNPDIYFLDSDWNLGQALIENWGIDISPEFDRQGDKMVFVSSRLGNPHIFLYDFQTEKVTRISYKGTYNTHPSLSPDGRFIAYSRRTDQGHRIIVHDLQNKEERRVTSGPGNDEDPAWGPDSYFLAFSSSRSGTYKLYVTNRHGGEPILIPTGDGACTSPAWNPVVGD